MKTQNMVKNSSPKRNGQRLMLQRSVHIIQHMKSLAGVSTNKMYSSWQNGTTANLEDKVEDVLVRPRQLMPPLLLYPLSTYSIAIQPQAQDC